MKVLSIKEPYATLIKDKVKFIETRSWKTNYRGVLYIHASKSKVGKDILNKKSLSKLYNIDKLNYGKIICKCKLIDCIVMDTNFINKVKLNNNEYICGDYKIGRYAWILDDIEVLDNFIDTNGRLGIWNYEGDGL